VRLLYLDFNETDPVHDHSPTTDSDPATDRARFPRPGPVRTPATDTAENPEVTHAIDQEDAPTLPALDSDSSPSPVRDFAHDFEDCVCVPSMCIPSKGISFFEPSRVANRARSTENASTCLGLPPPDRPRPRQRPCAWLRLRPRRRPFSRHARGHRGRIRPQAQDQHETS